MNKWSKNKFESELTAKFVETAVKKHKEGKEYTDADIKKFVDDFYKKYGKMMSKFAKE